MRHNFNEKSEEYSTKQKKKIPVWQSPKYEQSRAKAVEIIEKYDNIQDGDFWILMNETKTGKMAYTGLIISHNACLKLNDHLTDKFSPECVSLDKDGYAGSLVFTYCNEAQGIYEVGEVSKANCKNDYPYAMAYKRMFDRVVLKLTKLAYDGVYSDSEADEFKEPVEESEEAVQVKEASKDPNGYISTDRVMALLRQCDKDGVTEAQVCAHQDIPSFSKMTKTQNAVLSQNWSRIISNIKDNEGIPFK